MHSRLWSASSATAAADEGDQLALQASWFVRYNVIAAVAGALLAGVSIAFVKGGAGATLCLFPGVALCVTLHVRHSTPWLRNLTIFALTAGVVELAVDAWLVHVTHTLLYPAGEPLLWASPLYMPVAWFGMISGCFANALFLRTRFSMWSATLIVASIAAVYVPMYEEVAAYAGWWVYRDTPMLFDQVPTYIVIGEGLMAIPLVWICEALSRMDARRAFALGACQGVWIGISYALALALV